MIYIITLAFAHRSTTAAARRSPAAASNMLTLGRATLHDESPPRPHPRLSASRAPAISTSPRLTQVWVVSVSRPVSQCATPLAHTKLLPVLPCHVHYSVVVHA